MQDQILRTYHDLMQRLTALPADIDALQEALTTVKLQLSTSEKTLKDLEADLRLKVEGKNAEERTARLTQTLQQTAVYRRWSHAADTERREASRLQDKLDGLTRQYGAICYQARLHAGLMNFLGSAGAPVVLPAAANGNPLDTDISFYPTGGAQVSAADAAAIGL
jgi:hypothetical protein